MGVLNQEVRHVQHVVDGSQQPVTGLVLADYTWTLQRYDTTTQQLVAASESLAVTELSGGDYLLHYTPTRVGLYYLQAEPTNATYSADVSTWEDDIEAGYAATSGPYLCTVAGVKAANNITDSQHDTVLDQLVAAMTDAVRRHAKRRLLRETRTVDMDGRDRHVLLLPDWPVESVANLWHSTDVPRVYDSSTLLTEGEDYYVNLDNGVVTHMVAEGVFRAGPATVRVELTAGWATVPADVERAAIECCVVKLRKGWSNLYHLFSQNVGEGNVGGILRDDWPMDARRVFDNLRRRGGA